MRRTPSCRAGASSGGVSTCGRRRVITTIGELSRWLEPELERLAVEGDSAGGVADLERLIDARGGGLAERTALARPDAERSGDRRKLAAVRAVEAGRLQRQRQGGRELRGA